MRIVRRARRHEVGHMLEENERADLAAELLSGFAERTGVGNPDRAVQRRYLWTDAFCVVTWIELSRRGFGQGHLDRAATLVEDVHTVLGRHRPDDVRQGWLSTERAAADRAHPTLAGLRIGKPLPERRADEPLDEQREWDRDGQYFHYLTRWIHALAAMSAATGEGRYLEAGVELARAACDGFVRAMPGGGAVLWWKMSIDLSRPLVRASSRSDPLDGWISCMELERLAGEGLLSRERELLGELVVGGPWATTDPLGLGSLITDALRWVRLIEQPGADHWSRMAAVCEGIGAGLDALCANGGFRPGRLAFRELGLAIGLQALGDLRTAIGGLADARGGGALAGAARFIEPRPALLDWLLGTWTSTEGRRAIALGAHRDIDEVMLAASLVPGGVLELPLRSRS